MPKDRKPNLMLPVAVVALLLLAGYVGAYYWLVQPMHSTGPRGRSAEPTWRIPYVNTHNRYYRPITAFFSPITWLDRRIRPDKWKLLRPLPPPPAGSKFL